MSISEVLKQRQATHGDFREHAEVTTQLKDAASCTGRLEYLPAVHREAIDMILHKIGRVIAGNHNHEDHWVDICGYAELVLRDIRSGNTTAT